MADILGVPYSVQTMKHLSWKFVCSQHFSEADFTSPECIHLNRMVVPTITAEQVTKCSVTVYSASIVVYSFIFTSDAPDSWWFFQLSASVIHFTVQFPHGHLQHCC